MAIAGAAVLKVSAETARFHTQMKEAADKLNSTTAQMKRSLDGLKSGFDKAGKAFKLFTNAFIALQFGFGVASIIKVTDAFNQMTAKIRNSVDEATNVTELMEQIIDSSNRTGIGVEDMAQAFTRLRPAALELGITNDQLLQFNETFQKMGLLAGSTSRELSQTMVQLSQAIVSDRLGGDELRSVLEQTSQLSKAIADEMRVPLSELKDLSKEGKITADVVFNAVLGKTAEVNKAFEELPDSVERSLNRVENSFKVMVNEINQATDSTTTFSKWLDWIAGLLDWLRPKIVVTGRTILQMGETSIQMGKLVFNGIKTAVTIVVTSIGQLIGLALQGIENLVNSTAAGINKITALANKIPGINIGNLGADFKMPGHAFFDKAAEGGIQFAAKFWGQTAEIWDQIMSGKSVFNQPKTFLTGLNTAKPSIFKKGTKEEGQAIFKKGTEEEGQEKAFEERRLFEIEQEALSEGLREAQKIWDEEERLIKEANAVINSHATAMTKAIEEWNEYKKAIELVPQTQEDISRVYKEIFEQFEDKEELTKEASAALEMQRSILFNLRGDTEGYEKALIELNKVEKTHNLSIKEKEYAISQLKTQFGLLKDSGVSAMQELIAAVNNFGRTIEDTLIKAVMTGKLSFKELADAILEDLARIAIRMALMNIIGVAGSYGKAGTGIIGWIEGLFGGGKASGGPVSPGKTYLVGEKGPELLSMGSNSGRIIPNNQLATASGGSTAEPIVVYMSINAVDAPSFVSLVVSQKKLFENMAINAVQKISNARGKAGVLDS